jgi:hypothetical protein
MTTNLRPVKSFFILRQTVTSGSAFRQIYLLRPRRDYPFELLTVAFQSDFPSGGMAGPMHYRDHFRAIAKDSVIHDILKSTNSNCANISPTDAKDLWCRFDPLEKFIHLCPKPCAVAWSLLLEIAVNSIEIVFGGW